MIDNVFPENKVEEILEFLNTVSPESKIYLGCDSYKFRKKNGRFFATFTLVVIIHKNNANGCKVFYHNTTEEVYDNVPGRPSYRLMQEVYKVSALYLQLYPLIGDRDVEIHLDINPDKKHGSSCVVTQAVGYVRGVCGFDPKIKPEAFAASYGADRYN